MVEPNNLQFSWAIAPEHYLYKDKITIINCENTALLKQNALPMGTVIDDPIIGKHEVYHNNLMIDIPWQHSDKNQKLLVHYQGCAKAGVCYLPISKEVTVIGNQIEITDTSLQSFPNGSTADQIATSINERFLPLTLIVFFFLGILLSFTPCVLPMIPLIVNLIIGPKPISTHRAFVLSMSYVIGMAGSYTAAGVIAGMLGATLQVWLQQPLVIITLSILLVILALSQFDLIHISMPHFNNKLHRWGAKQLQGSIIGAFILGMLAALIVSPCITPPLIGALTYISQSGNPWIGGLTLLSLGLGMGVPLIVVALLSSIILPAAGPWMNLIKTIAGVALLGLAIWLLDRILPPYIILILWGSLCLIGAVFLKAFESSKNTHRIAKIFKGIGIVLAIYGAALIINAIHLQFSNNRSSNENYWQDIDSRTEFEKQLAVGQSKKEITILEVYANWCTNCKKIEATVFTNREVLSELKRFNRLRIDMSVPNEKQEQLLSSLKIYGPPTILFFDTKGKEIIDQRITGDISAQEMLQMLQEL